MFVVLMIPALKNICCLNTQNLKSYLYAVTSWNIINFPYKHCLVLKHCIWHGLSKVFKIFNTAIFGGYLASSHFIGDLYYKILIIIYGNDSNKTNVLFLENALRIYNSIGLLKTSILHVFVNKRSVTIF